MEKDDELFIPKTKHKGLKITLAILLIAGLLVGAYFLYQYKFNNPKVIVNKIFDGIKESASEVIKKVDTSKKYRINGHADIKVDVKDNTQPIFDVIKDMELLFSGEIDDQVANITLDTKYRDKKLIDVQAYYENKTMYFLVSDIYDKWIKAEIKSDEEEKKNEIKISDIKTIYVSLIDAYKEEFDKQEMKTVDTKITVDEKEVEVINNYVELKDKEVNKFIEGVANTLKNNKEFMSAAVRITGEEEKELIKELNDMISEEEFQGVYKVSFYTDKGLLNKKLISIRQDIVQEESTDKMAIDFIDDGELLITLNSDDTLATIRIKASNSKISMTLTEVVDELGSLSSDISINYETIKEITKPDLSNSKALEEITEEEFNSIQEKLAQNANLQKLIEAFSKTFKLEA